MEIIGNNTALYQITSTQRTPLSYGGEYHIDK